MKHRSNIFLVIREYEGKETVIGAYRTIDRADEVAAGYSQYWEDTGLPEAKFFTRVTTFYDE